MSNPSHTARWQKITLATLFVGYTGYYLCRSNLSVANQEISADASDGISAAEIGMVAAIGTLAYALGKVSNGVLADFFDGRRLFLLGMLASIACTIALVGFGHGFLVFALIWGVNRYVQSMGWGALMNISARWFPVSVQATAMGFLSLSYLFGDALVKLYLGTCLRFGLNWRELFLVSAATLALVALATAFFLKSSPKDVGAEEPPVDPANLFGASGDRPPESLGSLLIPLLANPIFWIVCVMNVGLTLIREALTFWSPNYLKEFLNTDTGTAAQYSMLVPLAGGVAALLGGRLSDRLQGRHALVALPALVLLSASLLAMGLVPLTGRPTLALFLTGAAAFFLMAPYSFCSGVIALNLGGKRGSSTAAGIIDATGYLGASLSGGVAALKQHFGWGAVFLVLAGAAVLTALVTCLYWLLQPRRPDDDANQREESSMNRSDPVDYVLTLFRTRGSAAYIGEAVSQAEHALQAAWAAEKSGAGATLITAALLHDIGHLLHPLPEDCAEQGIDDRHEALGARWVEQSFGPAVSEPIRLHVSAKRYLSAVEPDYRDRLSPASQLSLQLQGGPFSIEELKAFLGNAHAEAALRLRRWDEEAKTPGLKTPYLDHFRPYLEAARADWKA